MCVRVFWVICPSPAVRACLEAIVWTQFPSRCIGHRQGVVQGGHACGLETGEEGKDGRGERNREGAL